MFEHFKYDVIQEKKLILKKSIGCFMFLLFSMAIALKTYFQKIADPKDLASASAVSFTINHIAAVFLPAILGLIWLYSPSLVFFIGANIAVCSLCLSFLIPQNLTAGHETTLKV